MERQNITLSIPRETLKKAKHLAIYAYDFSAPEKSEAAKKLISGLWESGLGVISIQTRSQNNNFAPYSDYNRHIRLL